MKVTKFEAYAVDMPLARPYTIAYKTVSAVQLVFLQIHTDSGHIGWGSANPSPHVVGETSDDTLNALRGESVEQWYGTDIRSFHKVLDEVEMTFSEQPGVMAAIDMALHDLFCQYLNVPVATYLGQHHTSLPTSITIGIKGVEETLAEAEEYIGRGFTHLKVKLGQSLEQDLERLYKLREVYGPTINIRVDANQGYTQEEVLSFHQSVASLGLELVEQPLPAKDIAGMRSLPEDIRQYLAADESLVSPADALALAIAPHASGIFNIKLMKCGGIRRAKRIADIASLAGISLMWGCNDESIISITAALHAAFSCPHTRYIDLDGSLDLASHHVQGGFTIEKGIMRLTEAPGLGVSQRA